MIVRAGTVAAVGPELTLDVRLVPYGVEATVTDDGRTTYREVWHAGGLAVVGRAAVYAGHRHNPATGQVERGPLIGAVIDHVDDPAGPIARVQLADTPTARDVHALAGLVGATVSIEADPPPGPAPAPGARIVRSAAAPARLTGLAVLLPPDRGAFPGADVLAVRTQPDPEPGGIPTMNDPDTPTPDPDPADPGPEPVAGLTRAAIAELVRGELARVTVRSNDPAPVHPIARYRSLGDYALARMNDEVGTVDRLMARAWVDQITGDNPGVMPPAWLTTVFGIIDRRRPVITALGGARPLPDAGMSVEYPYFDGTLTDIVGVQAVEKTEVTSVKVSIKRGTEGIETYAGGSDVSMQLLRRSSPSYLEAYTRILLAAYGEVTDRALAAKLATSTATAPAPADSTPGAIAGAVFAASDLVDEATGMPATVVLAAPDVFTKLGGIFAEHNAANPVVNAAGTAVASSLTIGISGLRVVKARGLAAGVWIATNDEAASWHEDGPDIISALDVPKLGEDRAVYGFATPLMPLPAGVVKIGAIPAPVAATARSSK